MSVRVVIVPGNGGGEVDSASMWYIWVKNQLDQMDNIKEAALKDMPDPFTASEKAWIPFMRGELGCDEDTIIIGHSSGAEAAMRYAEQYKVFGIILVSACVTDLGDESERESGYYNRPWEWEKIKKNTKFRVQFGSSDDPFIPWSEQQEVSKGLGSEFLQFTNKGHFNQQQTFPEIITVIEKHAT